MHEKELQELGCALASLSVFRGLLDKPPMRALLRFLGGAAGLQERMGDYGAFVYALAEDGYCFSAFLQRALYADENAFAAYAARGEEMPAALAQNAQAELAFFTRLSRLDAAALCGGLSYTGYVPAFQSCPVDFEAAYMQRLKEAGRRGYGLFSTARMFRLAGDAIVPVMTADAVGEADLTGYETERQRVFSNAAAFLAGRPAANMLLYGDAGTGKSSTVKACVNRYYEDGLRLIELRKDQLGSLPLVMERIAGNPLKFILFIDDLSFCENDDAFAMLKAALEGSACAKADNAILCATSNRRHIIKESFSQRQGADDVHRNDTMQEAVSLSQRFGLRVYFARPDKTQYLQIVRALAQKRGAAPEEQALFAGAEAFALAQGGRSPRIAAQYVDSLL